MAHPGGRPTTDSKIAEAKEEIYKRVGEMIHSSGGGGDSGQVEKLAEAIEVMASSLSEFSDRLDGLEARIDDLEEAYVEFDEDPDEDPDEGHEPAMEKQRNIGRALDIGERVLAVVMQKLDEKK